MLDERKSAILRAIVQEYITTAQPVGSTLIANSAGVNVSSATVRNEMAVLEQEGYVAQPHTSAGRIPTDKGYRFYVDHVATPGRLDAVAVRRVGDFFDSTHGRLEELLHQTSNLLAQMTSHAAVVVGPSAERAVVRTIQLVGLSDHHATIVAVLSNGTVEDATIELPRDTSDARLAAASAHLSANVVSQVLEPGLPLRTSGDDAVDDLCGAAIAALHPDVEEPVFVGGAASMAQAFDAVDTVRTVLRTLEQQYVIVTLVRDMIGRGLSVAIGTEHGIEPLSACSVVVAPVVVDGEQLGTVGVLGPTRMDYPQALATVEVVSDRLGRRLGTGGKKGGLMAEDYYRLLGVTPDATPDELKKAYRAKARELHPDANRDDPDTAEQFKLVAQAYEVLSDPTARARYDRYGESGMGGAGAGAGPNFTDMFGGAGLGDLLGTIFGGGSNPFGGGGPAGPPRGQDLEVVADITFEQSIFGATVPVTVHTAVRCDDCQGTGAGHGTQPVMCSECEGRGQVQRVRQSMLGQMVTATVCPKCGGLGEVVVTPCPTCGGDGRLLVDKTYQVDVPPGVDTGSTLRLSGRGAVGPRNGAAGDLYVHLRVAQSELFQRDGDDLVHVFSVSIAQASLGTRSMLATPDGEVELVIQPGTQPGRELVFRGKGVPRLRGRGRGDLRVLVHVEVPTRLTDQEAELLRKLAELRGEQIGVPEPGLFSRIKSAFQ